ncbi:MAG: UDP-N-acetylglucosamine 2-epimerase [Omnitrophica bacterium]|nr:UDP-N-acetylglucosamine 2-epimerase [Candidatus Omnitrophota bacterium]
MKRKIAIVTGARADYGLLYWVIRLVQDDPDLKLELLVTGMHLSPEFGLTVREIEKDGFSIAEKIDMRILSDTEEAIAASMGFGMIGFAKVYARLKPDIIVVLGDRFEVHAAVSAAIPFRIPVAHIHGGEATEGVIDEPLRHAITKMSHIHFPATEKYKKRIIQMGENPKHVFCFGAPGIDNILKLDFLDHDRLCEELDIPGDKKIGIVTYHPVTLEFKTGDAQITELLRALDQAKEIYWVFTMTNADTGGRAIITQIEKFVKAHSSNTMLHRSLGQKRYLSLLRYATLMVGNSSSGLIEAPSFELPVVNIGDRQKGRAKTENVIDVEESKKDLISKAIDRAISPAFRKSLAGLKNPYGNGGASERIVETLKNFHITESLIKKKFFEIGK